MDLGSILGIILGVIAIVGGMIFKGADPSALANPAAIMIILLGTTATILIAFPLKDLKKFGTLVKIVFTNPKGGMTETEMLKLFVSWAQAARKNGLLALEGELKKVEDDFIQRWMKCVIDGVPAEEIREMMEAEIESIEARHKKGSHIFTQAGTYAPTLGVLGAVVGLVAALGNLGDIEKLGHAIAGAFIATLFGIFTGYVLWHPFANKLKQKSSDEVSRKHIIAECILLLQSGAYPSVVENKIKAYMSTKDRAALAKDSGKNKGDS